MAALRILTFNFHEPYLCLMAKTGLPLTVGVYSRPGLARNWQTGFRPIPKNITLVEERLWRHDLAGGKFDVVVAQNETNAIDVFNICNVPALLVCHNRRTFLTTTIPGDPPGGVEKYNRLLEVLQRKFDFIFISEAKRNDYGIPGSVIYPGIDVSEYGGYRGDTPEILRVGNLMRARDLMFDVDFQERVCHDLPNRVIGEDPLIPGARPSRSFVDLLDAFRSMRCLLHVTREAYEDGYNLSMLEAMACGMPVVALANPTSPLTDGVDGFLSYDGDVLRQRLQELLADPDAARRIGARGREAVAGKFPLETFVDQWRTVLEQTAQERGRHRAKTIAPRRAGAIAPAMPRTDILLDYVSSPYTTGRYFEQAARTCHNVVTAGMRLPEALLAQWEFDLGTVPHYPVHQIDVPPERTYKQLLEKMPKGFQPEIYLWVDAGLTKVADDIHLVPAVKLCYLIDTHLDPDVRIEIARHFDYTFLAQKRQVPEFVRAGIPNVAWLPLACSPELHEVGPLERIYDVAFVGRPQGDANPRRRNLIDAIAQRFPNSRICQCWPDEMARVYAQAKIVVNACVNFDVNMRVFEAMAAGALLVTDQADGLEDLFDHGKHLIIYRNDEEVFDLIANYLRDDAARERIAENGRALVLFEHTYDRRLAQMLEAAGRFGGNIGESRFSSGGYYRAPRWELVSHVPLGARRVLDVGCGAGDFGRTLKQCGVREVVGIEIVERAWRMAKGVLDDALLGNVETMELPFPDGHFDCICFGDVLEHLVEPSATLRRIARVLDRNGAVIASIPNVRFFQVVAALADGRWQYQDAGILDRTHLRFFTRVDMRELFESAGLEVLAIHPLSKAPAAAAPRNSDGAVTLGRITMRPHDDADYQDLLTYQYVVVAAKPGADPLAKARSALENRYHEEAYALAENAVGADPFEKERLMALALARIGKLDRAEELYRKALEARPEDPDVLAQLGILLVAMNRSGEAKTYLERTLQTQSDHDRALGALGLVHLAEGRKHEAFECFTRSLEIDFDNEGILTSLIHLASQLNRFPDAERFVRRFVDFHPGNAGMVCAFAALLHKEGKRDEARQQLETLLVLSPQHEIAQTLLAQITRENP